VLAEIIEPRLEELMTLVHKELQRAGCLSLLTSGIVLTGGSSQLHGLPEFIENHFSAPVRIGRPLGVSGLVDLVGTPESATVVGLAFAAARSVRRNELHGQGGGVFRNITRRVNAWFSGE
jgi:cell division protein FtsA